MVRCLQDKVDTLKKEKHKFTTAITVKGEASLGLADRTRGNSSVMNICRDNIRGAHLLQVESLTVATAMKGLVQGICMVRRF